MPWNYKHMSIHETITPSEDEALHTPYEITLSPEEQVQIDLNAPMASSQEMNEKVGMPGSLVATVLVGGKDFMILDTRKTGSNREFFIIDNTYTGQKEKGYKGITAGNPVTIGRRHHAERFTYPDTVSAKHFEVSFENESLFIRNLKPTNRTRVTANFIKQQEQEKAQLPGVVDSRTVRAQDRLKGYPNYGEEDEVAPYGYYMNHPVLGRESRTVSDGVYLGGSSREAIVVDSKSTILRDVYERLASEFRRALSGNETLEARSALLQVMRRVQDVMPYNGDRTDEISQRYKGDMLVGLSTYVKEKAGVCRHQGLLAAFIIENLISDGFLPGSVGVERNTVEDRGGTHAWAIYKTSENGKQESVVVDPAQSFVGTKEQANKDGRWEYRLNSD